jgi:hypothetical protein
MKIATIALAALTALSFAAPAFADQDDWYRGRNWREHEWREREWREHHSYYRPYAYSQGYYYAPPPVVYARPPAVAEPSLNFVIRLGR